MEKFQNLNKTWCVYLLTCKNTPKICYVGITNKNYAIERLFYHFVESVTDSRTGNEDKHDWIINNWRYIDMKILEPGIENEDDARSKEASYVFKYKKDGFNVLNKTYVAVRCFDNNGNYYKDYASYAEAAKEFNVTSSRIIQCVSKKMSLFKMFYFIKYDESITHYNIPKSPNIDSTHILQYNSNGDFIKEWDSALSVCTELQINRSQMVLVLRDTAKTAKGFHFIKKVSNIIPEKIDLNIKVKIELYKDGELIKKFSTIADCAQYLIDNNYTDAKKENIRGSLSKNGKVGKPYLGFDIRLY